MSEPLEFAALQQYLLIAGLLFGIGLVGFLARRNLIIMFLSAEMMLQGVSLSFVAWSRFHHNWGGQAMTIFIIAVAACEAAIALALVLTVYHKRGSLDVAAWQQLRETGQPPFVDEELPEEVTVHPHWPHLTPAGVAPKSSSEEQLHRPHV